MTATPRASAIARGRATHRIALLVRTALATFLLLVAGCPLVDFDGLSGSDPATLDGGEDTSIAADASVVPLDGEATSPYAQSVLEDRPAAYYRFEEATDVGAARDSSGNGHDAKFVGGVTLGAAGALANEVSRAVRFDGKSGFVRIGDLFHFRLRAPMSVEVWAKPDLVDGEYRGVISNEPLRSEEQREGYVIFLNAPRGMGFERFSGGARAGAVAPSPPLDVYSHIVVTYDGTKARGYVNAIEVLSFDSVLNMVAAPDAVMTIGARVSGAGGVFAGSLDEVAIYEGALTPARIAVHYQLGSGR